MLAERTLIHNMITSFLDLTVKTQGCVLLGFDHDHLPGLVTEALAPFATHTRCCLVRFDFAYFCWSPEHFLSQSARFLTTLEGLPCFQSSVTARPQKLAPANPKQTRPDASMISGFVSGLERIARQSGKRLVVIGENVQQLHIFSHYPHFGDAYQKLQQAIKKSSGLLFILMGSLPTRRESSYETFIKSGVLQEHRVGPLSAEEISVWLKEQGCFLSSDLCLTIQQWTAGIQAYLPFVVSFCSTSEGKNETRLRPSLDKLFTCSSPQYQSLERYVHYRYFLSLERAKGFGSLRTVLSTLAGSGPLNLTHVAAAIGKGPSAVKDYLDSLAEVGLVVKTNKVYTISDPIMARWIRSSENKWAAPHLFNGLETSAQNQYKTVLVSRDIQKIEPHVLLKKTRKKKTESIIDFD